MACTPTETNYCACTYVFSDWSACQPDGVQVRSIIGTPQPPGCIGVPQLWERCAIQCKQSITYTSDKPQDAAVVKDANPMCVGAGLEIALAVALAKLLQGP